MPEIRICDQAGCTKPATLSYRWDWGEEGACCQEHGLLLQQKSVNLSRGVSLTPLVSAPPLALTRDERTQLIAAKLSAEAEADEIRHRSAQLYQQNVDLTNQVQTLTLRNREANGALKQRETELEALRTELDAQTAELANALDEVQRLTTLCTFAPSSPTPVPAFGPPADAPIDG